MFFFVTFRTHEIQFCVFFANAATYRVFKHTLRLHFLIFSRITLARDMCALNGN